MTTASPHPILHFLAQQGSTLANFLILTHDHPDPDAIASAWALATLAERAYDVRARIGYGGIIGRMENQMMVRLLRIPLQPITPEELERCPHVALVDTQPPFQNNRFPPQRRATFVIDHHPRHAKTEADVMLIDEKAGATATLLVEALLASKLPIPSPLATALVYGIGSETQQLGREAGARDIEAYRRMLDRASMPVLSKIQNPPRPSSFFYTLGKAIHRAFTVKNIIGVHLGPVPSQDIVAHMADFLLTHEKMRWSIVTGRYDGRLYVSLRTYNPRAEAGRLLWRLLGGGTAGGGHSRIAGGAIDVGKEADEPTWQRAETQLVTAFLRSQGHREPFGLQHPYHSVRTEGVRG